MLSVWSQCAGVHGRGGGVGCFFQAEDGIRDLVRSRGLGDVYKRQSKNNLFKDAKSVDLAILKMVKELTKNLEVKSASHKQWENAILEAVSYTHLTLPTSDLV